MGPRVCPECTGVSVNERVTVARGRGPGETGWSSHGCIRGLRVGAPHAFSLLAAVLS